MRPVSPSALSLQGHLDTAVVSQGSPPCSQAAVQRSIRLQANATVTPCLTRLGAGCTAVCSRKEVKGRAASGRKPECLSWLVHSQVLCPQADQPEPCLPPL